MDILDIARWVVPIVLAAIGFFIMQRMMGRVSKQGTEKLMRFGLSPVPGTSKSGSSFKGRYRDIECGYHWGTTAFLTSRVNTQGGNVTSGSEFWVALGFDGPPLAVVERGEKAWRRFEGADVPKAEVPTGDPAFDQRFAVRCEDPAWVQTVLGPAVRAQLLQVPLLFLVQADQKVIFPLYFDGTRLFSAIGADMKEAWSIMDHSGVFLDAAILLVEQLSVARQA
jgi:hypothetical protein